MSELIERGYSEQHDLFVRCLKYRWNYIGDFINNRPEDEMLGRIFSDIFSSDLYVTDGFDILTKVDPQLLYYRVNLYGRADFRETYVPIPKISDKELLRKFRIGDPISSKSYQAYYSPRLKRESDWKNFKDKHIDTGGYTNPYLFIENETYSVCTELYDFISGECEVYEFARERLRRLIPIIRKLEGLYLCTPITNVQTNWDTHWELLKYRLDEYDRSSREILNQWMTDSNGQETRGRPSKEAELLNFINMKYDNGIPPNVSIYKLNQIMKQSGIKTSERSLGRLRAKYPEIYQQK